MFNKIKRAFSTTTSHVEEKKVDSGEDGKDEEEDATKVLDGKIKRTKTLKDKRKERVKGPKNRRSPSKKKHLFDRFLAKFNINKKEQKTEVTVSEEVTKVTTKEDAKATEDLNIVEKTEVLQRVERAPPPKNRRRPQRHNQRTEYAKPNTTHVKKEIDSGGELVINKNDVSEAKIQEGLNKKNATRDEKIKRKIITPKTFSLDREKEMDGKNKPPLPGKEKPLKEKEDSNDNERRFSEESLSSNPRHSASDEEGTAKMNLFSNVASELEMKLAKKIESPMEDTGSELYNDNKTNIVEKPKLPTAKKPLKQEKPQIHTILEESESLDSTVSIEDQIQRLPDKNGNLQNDNRNKEKPTLPLNKKPNRPDNEKLTEEQYEPFHDSKTFLEEKSSPPVELNIHNALAAELQRKLSKRPPAESQKQKPNLPQKKKPVTKDNRVNSENEYLENEINDTKEVINKSKKPQVPSKQKPKKLIVNIEDRVEKSPKDGIIDCTIEDKINGNYSKETVERDLEYEPTGQMEPQIPKTPTKDIPFEIINQDDNNNENNDSVKPTEKSVDLVANGKSKAPVKPPRTKRRVQSNSEIPNDKDTPKRRTQSNSETKTPDLEIYPTLGIKKKTSFDEEINYANPQSPVDSLTDNEDLSDIFDVFDQEFDDQIKSLPPSRKSSVRSISRSSVRSMSRSSIRSLSRDSTPSFREPDEEKLTELLLEIANSQLDMTIELNKIENNNIEIDEKEMHEEEVSNPVRRKILDNKDLECNENIEDPVKKASEIRYEWIEDYNPSTKQILNPRENKDNEHISTVIETNEAKIFHKINKPNENDVSMVEMLSGTKSDNIIEDTKIYVDDEISKISSETKVDKISNEGRKQYEDNNERNKSIETNEVITSFNDKQNKEDLNFSKTTSDVKEAENSNEEAKQNEEHIISKPRPKTAKIKFDLGEGDIMGANFQKYYKSQQSRNDSKASVDELQGKQAVGEGPLNVLEETPKSVQPSAEKSVTIENLPTTNEPEVPQSPSENTRTPPARPRPGRPTPPGKKPQLNRLRNQNNPKPKIEASKLDLPLASSDLFALGREPSFKNERDPMVKKKTDDRKALVKNSTQYQQSVNKSDSSQTEDKHDTIYSNFQRPRAETQESSIQPPRAEMQRLQSVPPITKLPSRSTPPTSRHRHTSPQIYVDLGGKAPKPTYMEPGQINQTGRERSDSLRSSSPRKQNETKDKGDKSKVEH